MKCHDCDEEKELINYIPSSLAYDIAHSHELWVSICELCSVKRQLQECKNFSSRIPELEKKLAELEKKQ